ncbi:MAG TPA: adenosylmethionine decarboxylase, partial [Elusimicrobiota bacterium]|nr:adenosylmethionine decarboxylase [Elusimicrobiota bacterium]
MFFEGPEKKLELALAPGQPSLRARGLDYWKMIVGKARAQILSSLSNESLDAHLLSESSLFVADNWLTMITCGRTDL